MKPQSFFDLSCYYKAAIERLQVQHPNIILRPLPPRKYILSNMFVHLLTISRAKRKARHLLTTILYESRSLSYTFS